MSSIHTWSMGFATLPQFDKHTQGKICVYFFFFWDGGSNAPCYEIINKLYI